MSRRFFLYLLLMGAAYALYSFSAASQLLFLLVILIALPLCSFILLFIARYFVRVELTAEKKQVYRLEPFSLFMEIRNRGPFFFPLIKIEFNLPRGSTALEPEKDWQKGLQRSSQGVHFFNEYMDYSGDEYDDTGLEPVQNYPPDRRKVFRFYPAPHLAKVRKIITAVLPQMSTSFQEIHFSARHRGVFSVGTDSILLQDIFGFFYLPLPRKSRRNKDGSSRLVIELEVLPNPNRWLSPRAGKLRAPEQVLMNARDLKVSNEVDTLANVREYRPGDRIKQIHWKLSSRSDTFLTREFEDPRQGGILFLLDPKLPDDCVDPMSYSDEVPEIMAAVMRLLAKTEGPLNLLLGEDYFTAAGEGVEPVSFYRAMMHWKPEIRKNDPRTKDPETREACSLTDHRIELSNILQKECKRQRYRAIVVITARMNDQLAQELQRAQKIGSQVLLIFLHNEQKQDLEKMLHALASASVRLFPTRLSSLIPYKEAVAGSEQPDPSADGKVGRKGKRQRHAGASSKTEAKERKAKDAAAQAKAVKPSKVKPESKASESDAEAKKGGK